jgi:ubiquinone/menaquinone biosynthesis C-methylase UbiE
MDAEFSARHFGKLAHAYLESAVHAQGADLSWLQDLARHLKPVRILDLGCGAGHVSFALAPHTQEMLACDPSPEMLALLRQEAERRSLTIQTLQGRSEALPLAADHLDWVVSRFSAHHWSQLPQALLEIHRVLRPGGLFVLIDTTAPEDPRQDTFL